MKNNTPTPEPSKKIRKKLKSLFQAIGSFVFVFALNLASAQNFSADPLTGLAVGNIPIWTINSGDIAAGISLKYSSNIKVNDPEMSAGMGWSLSAGGAVSREVRGLPDDYVGALSGVSGDLRNGWLHGNAPRRVKSFIPSADLNYAICSDEAQDFNTVDGFGYTDTEPDIFSFSAPGLSGQFVFDNNKLVQTIPYQDLKIQITRESSDSLITQIIITNNTGTQYTFSQGDKVNRYLQKGISSRSFNYFNQLYFLYQKPATYYGSWVLTQITSAKGGAISFGYANNFTSATKFLRIVIPPPFLIDTLYTDTYDTQSQLLQTITGSNEKATITWTGGIVSTVDIVDLTYGQTVKKFGLTYSHAYGQNSNPKKQVARAFLSGLNEELSCKAFPGYKFSYYGVNFPPINAPGTTSLPFNSGLHQDIFGYYDSTAISEVPDVLVQNNDAGTNGERYRIAPASGYTTYLSTGGGRVVNPSKVYFGSLKSVTLPSGGTTTYTYEAADYYDALTNSTIMGGGSRVKKIKTSANDAASDVTVSYKYCSAASPSISSGQWVYRPMFVIFGSDATVTAVPDNMAPNESILYSRVEASTTGRGKTVYEFQNAGMYGTIALNDFSATLMRIARDSSGCVPVGSLKSGYYTFPYVPNTNYDFERGLPTHITDYNRNGKLVQRKNYTYQRTTLAVDQVSALRMEMMGGMYVFGKYSVLSNVNKVTYTEAVRVYDQAYTDTTTQFVENKTTYTYNSNQMLSKVALTNSDNSIVSTTYKYANDYPITSGNPLTTLVNANRHGTLVESVSYNGSTVTGAALTLFDNYTPYQTSLVLPSQQLVLGDPTGFSPSTVSGASMTYSPNYYAATYYDKYDVLGHPIAIRDQSRRISSSILGYNNSAVVLDIGNARYDQVVYADFEPGNIMAAASVNASVISTDYWSGKYCAALSSGNYVLQNAVFRGSGKNYRFSCWAKASAATSLTISINGNAVATVPYPNSGASVNTWQYVEATVDMSTVTAGASFSFKATANGSINLDNVVFYPESASVAAHAYDPLNGKTADLDSRGVSGFKDYDDLGRVRYLKNMDKDIVQINDYHYQSALGVLPVSDFSGPNSPDLGVAVTYTAWSSCVSVTKYSWYVFYNGTQSLLQSSASPTFTYTFTHYATYRVILEASSSEGVTRTEMEVNPNPVFNASLVINGPQPIDAQYCDTDPQYTLSVNFGNPIGLSNVSYWWYYNLGANPSVNLTDPESSISSVIFQSSWVTATVHCYVVGTYTNETNGKVQEIVTNLSQDFICRNRPGQQ